MQVVGAEVCAEVSAKVSTEGSAEVYRGALSVQGSALKYAPPAPT